MAKKIQLPTLAAAIIACSALCASSVTAAPAGELALDQNSVMLAPDTGSSQPKIYYNDGARIEFPDSGFTMQITTFMKNAYIYTDAPTGTRDTSSFEVRNARIVFSGKTGADDFGYKLEYDARLNTVLDGYFTYAPTDWSEIKLGQFKSPISRQFVNHSFKLMFPDASYASNYFNYGYQNALKGTVKLLDNQVVAAASVTNGNSQGEGPYGPGVDTKLMTTAELRWNALGKMNAYEESDANYTEDPALSVAAVYAYSPQDTKIGDALEEITVNRGSADISFKYRGLGMNAEYYVSQEDPDLGDSWTTQGTYIQAGYFVMPKKVEVAGRWSYVDCDSGKGLGVCSGIEHYDQATGGINYYIKGYNLKLQLAYDYLTGRTVTDTSRDQQRVMFQVIGIM